MGKNRAFLYKMCTNVLVTAMFYQYKSKGFSLSISVSVNLVLDVIAINDTLTCLQSNTCKVHTAVFGSDNDGSDTVTEVFIRDNDGSDHGYFHC